MAGENQKTGPNTQGQGSNQGPSQNNIRDLRQGLRELLDDQGDYNNLLKTALRDLDSMQKSYTRIAAKIDSLNKGSINVKNVQHELYNLTQKQYISRQKVLDLEEGLSEESKSLVKEQERLNSLLGKAFTENQKNLVNKKLQENAAKISANIELQHLEYSKAAAKISEEEVNKGKQRLEEEKKVAKQIGISGNLAKLFADKLGVGQEAYEAMSFTSRKLVKEQGDQVTNLGKWKVAATGIAAAGKAMLSNIADPLVFLPIIGTALSGVVKGFMSLVELGLSVQDRTTKFGRALGMSAGEAQRVRNQFTQIAYQSNSVLVNTERLMASQEELTGVLGTNNILSGQILETNIQLKELAGLEAETRGEIAKSSIITGKSSEQVTKSVLAQVAGLKAATGISFNYQRILKEASSLGGYLGLSFAKYPAQLTKSLVTVKAMGLELKQLDQMADSFLDFESSISKEFEAQLLTGKEINLNRAREAFLTNDLATAASEITKQVGSASDFLKLNRIQAESLASAFGMSRDQMGEMLKQQELLSKIGAKQGDSAREQLRLGLERFKNQKALAAAVGDEAYQSLVNASSQEKIAAFMDKIKQAIADFVANSPLIPLVERAINWLSDRKNIQSVVSYIQDAFAAIFDIVGKTAGVIMKAANFFGAGIDQSIIDTAMSGGASIRAMNLAGSVPQAVGETAAKNATTSSPYQIPEGNSMSMAKAPQVYVLVNVDPITGLKTQKVITQDVYERQFGPMTNQYKAG